MPTLSQLKPGQSFTPKNGIKRVVVRHNDDGTVLVKRMDDDKGWLVVMDGSKIVAESLDK